jgi:hypothetical protein
MLMRLVSEQSTWGSTWPVERLGRATPALSERYLTTLQLGCRKYDTFGMVWGCTRVQACQR